MSISAAIAFTREEGDDLVLGLGPWQGEGPGQPELRISGCTVRPKPGRQIWGGAGFVVIEPLAPGEPRLDYIRDGYRTLIEDFRRVRSK